MGMADASFASPKAKPASRPKTLSCQRCRSRKTRCDRKGRERCTNCVLSNSECIRNDDDLRKKRPRADYVKSLEDKCRALEGIIDQLKLHAHTRDAAKGLDHFEADESSYSTSAAFSSPLAEPDMANTFMTRTDSLEPVVYGPVSIYGDTPISDHTVIVTSAEESLIRSLNRNPDILQCLQLFFTWQYPDHNMFIFREAFLREFLNPPASPVYCSTTLIFSICALGARMLDTDTIYQRSEQYASRAKSMLFSRLSSPSIASLQSFLVLAFYDICNGSNSSGWMLLGNAMRMGFDIGFQLHPQVWFLKLAKSLPPLEVNIRSRIYWGCYIADHFISLLLGRPSLLKMSDALIPESEDLPEMDGIDDFTYKGYQAKHMGDRLHHPCLERSYISQPMRNMISLINLSDQIIHTLFNKPLDDDDVSPMPRGHLPLEARIDTLYDCNQQILQWRQSLPPDLKWDREELTLTASNPGLVCIRYYYYIVILCLNRPFVALDNCKPRASQKSPLQVCLEAIIDVECATRGFVSVHGSRRLSVFMVYTSILLVSVLLLCDNDMVRSEEYRVRIRFFMATLKGASRTWKLAAKAYNLIASRLQERERKNKAGPERPPPMDAFAVPPPRIVPTVSAPVSATRNLLDNSATSPPVAPGALPGAMHESRTPPPHLAIPDHSANSILTQGMGLDSNMTETMSYLPPRLRQMSTSLHFDPIFSKPYQMKEECDGDIFIDTHTDFLGGPPVLMTSNIFGDDWEMLFAQTK